MLELYPVRYAAPFDVLVRHPVVRNLDAGDQKEFAVADDAMLPSRDFAGSIGRRLQALERLRAEHALGDVFFARPDQLHGTAHRLGNARALRRVIADRAAAEASAHVTLMEGDLVVGDAERLRHRLARLIRRLAAFPHVDLVAFDADHRVQRLHLGVIAVVAAERRLVGLGGGGKSGRHVALLLDRHGLRVRVVVDLDVGFERPLGVEAVGLGLLPDDFQRIAAGLGIFEVVGHHGKPVRQPDHVDHAFHRSDFGVVPRFRRGGGLVLLARIPDAGLRAVDGRVQGRGVDHARQLDVDCVLGAAVDLEWRVAPRHGLPDQPEILARLELVGINRRQRCRNRSEGGDLAIAETRPVGGIDHDARLGAQRRRINAPALRRVGDQHLAHLRAGHAQLGEIELHCAAADDPHEVFGAERILVAVNLGVRRGPFDGDLRPVGVHLLGDDERQRGHRALPHLGAGAENRDPAIRSNAHPRRHRRVRQGIGLRLRHQANAVVAKRDAERHAPQTGEHAAAGEITVDARHDQASRAARSMAAMMR